MLSIPAWFNQRFATGFKIGFNSGKFYLIKSILGQET